VNFDFGIAKLGIFILEFYFGIQMCKIVPAKHETKQFKACSESCIAASLTTP